MAEPVDIPLSQAAFARLKCWNRSTVTRLKQAGRIVMRGDKVDVAATERLLQQSNGGRDDVAQRHASEKGQPIPTPYPDAENITGSRISAQTRKENALADLAELERDQKRRLLIPRGEVETALTDVVSLARFGIENLPNRIAAQLVGKDHEAIVALLRQEVVVIMGEMHREARQKLVALTEGEGA